MPYISLMEMSLDGSKLSMFILYASCTMRYKMASANGLASPPSCSYQPSSLYCEQKMVEERFLLLCRRSKIALHSFSVGFISSHSSNFRKQKFSNFYIALTFGSGQEILSSLAFWSTLFTVFLEAEQLRAIFCWLKPRE